MDPRINITIIYNLFCNIDDWFQDDWFLHIDDMFMSGRIHVIKMSSWRQPLNHESHFWGMFHPGLDLSKHAAFHAVGKLRNFRIGIFGFVFFSALAPYVVPYYVILMMILILIYHIIILLYYNVIYYMFTIACRSMYGSTGQYLQPVQLYWKIDGTITQVSAATYRDWSSGNSDLGGCRWGGMAQTWKWWEDWRNQKQLHHWNVWFDILHHQKPMIGVTLSLKIFEMLLHCTWSYLTKRGQTIVGWWTSMEIAGYGMVVLGFWYFSCIVLIQMMQISTNGSQREFHNLSNECHVFVWVPTYHTYESIWYYIVADIVLMNHPGLVDIFFKCIENPPFQRFQAQEMGQESADIQAGFEKLNTARPESPRSWLQRIVSELLELV